MGIRLCGSPDLLESALLSWVMPYLSSPSIASILVFPLPVHSSYNTATSEDPSGCDFFWLTTRFQKYSGQIKKKKFIHKNNWFHLGHALITPSYTTLKLRTRHWKNTDSAAKGQTYRKEMWRLLKIIKHIKIHKKNHIK